MFKHNLVYKTTNLINGKIYIGVHRTDNLNDGYLGSGKHFKRSLRYYGKDKFKREILFDFDNLNDMLNKEIEFVTEEFCKRKDTYNLIIGGQGGNPGMVNVKDKNNNFLQVWLDDPRYISGELVGCTKGTVTVKNKNGNYLKVSKDDPRYISGELVFMTNGLVTVKDKDDNHLQVSINDPRYLSGELKSYWCDKKHTYETKIKMKQSKIGYNQGKYNNQYGTCWIYNIELNQNKKIKNDELTKYLNIGWIKGRLIKFNKRS